MLFDALAMCKNLIRNAFIIHDSEEKKKQQGLLLLINCLIKWREEGKCLCLEERLYYKSAVINITDLKKGFGVGPHVSSH